MLAIFELRLSEAMSYAQSQQRGRGQQREDQDIRNHFT